MVTLVLRPRTTCPATVAPTTLDATANVSLVSLACGYSTEVLNIVNTRPNVSLDRDPKSSGGSVMEPVALVDTFVALTGLPSLDPVVTCSESVWVWT